MIVIQHHGEAGEQARGVVAADDVGELVREHRATLVIVPRSPVVREQDHRPTSARRGGSRQIGDLAQCDVYSTCHHILQIAEYSDHRRVVDRVSATSAAGDRPEADRQAEQSGGSPGHRDRRQDAPPGADTHRRLGRPAPEPVPGQPQPREPQAGCVRRSFDVRAVGMASRARCEIRCGFALTSDHRRRDRGGRRPPIDARSGHERRSVQGHDQPEADGRDPGTRGRPAARRDRMQRQGRCEEDGHLDGQPRQGQSEVVHRPASFKICSRTARSSMVSLRWSTSRQSSWAREPRKTRWTRSPSSRPETSSYERTAL